MKIKLKMTLLMLCLLSVLFGIGGGTLISISYQSALNREKESIRDNFNMLLNALQVLGADKWEDRDGITANLEQLVENNTFSWSALRLTNETEFLYQSGSVVNLIEDNRHEADAQHCVIAVVKSAGGSRFLQLTGSFTVGEERLYLDIVRDVSAVYLAKDQQEAVYRRIYLVLVFLCAVLAYVFSWLLTRPLLQLTQASKEIAAGNLTCRAEVKTQDEIGELAGEFNDMAAKTERNIIALKDAVDRQERFMGAFTHELKTPMAAIIGHADLLRSLMLTPEEQSEAANYIFTEGRRLESLSVKLLEILVAGKDEIQLAEVSMADLLEDAAASVRFVFREKQIQVECEYEAGTCLLEPDLARSLLINLLSNAGRAVDAGGWIRIVSEMTAHGCIFYISDNGRGMDVETMKHITEAFYRADKSRSRRQGGAGLGLALCAKIVELHHGTLVFDSSPGQGTTVMVELKGGRV